jgi:hypothetical protein
LRESRQTCDFGRQVVSGHLPPGREGAG